MTSLDKRKSKLVFETCGLVRERGKYRQVVIQAEPHYAIIRLKGTRTTFPISYEAIYHHAAKIQSERVRAEKRAAKKGGKR